MKHHYLIPFMLLSCPALAQQAPIEKVYACVDVLEASERHACFDALIPELKRARTTSIAIPTTPMVKLQQQQAELGAPKPPPSPLTAPVIPPANRAATAPAPSADRVTLTVKAIHTGADGKAREVEVLCRIDTEEELLYYRHGGILPYVLRQLVARN